MSQTRPTRRGFLSLFGRSAAGVVAVAAVAGGKEATAAARLDEAAIAALPQHSLPPIAPTGAYTAAAERAFPYGVATLEHGLPHAPDVRTVDPLEAVQGELRILSADGERVRVLCTDPRGARGRLFLQYLHTIIR